MPRAKQKRPTTTGKRPRPVRFSRNVSTATFNPDEATIDTGASVGGPDEVSWLTTSARSNRGTPGSSRARSQSPSSRASRSGAAESSRSSRAASSPPARSGNQSTMERDNETAVVEPVNNTPIPTLEVSTVNNLHDTSGFGYETIPREHLDHWNNSMYILHPDDSFVHNGFVHSWHIFANRTVDITFQIWRPTHTHSSRSYGNRRFRLVGQNSFRIPHLGQHNFVVEQKQRVFFHEGDLIGIYFPNQNPIPFTKPSSNCSRPTLYLHKIVSPRIGKVYVFREHEPGWNPCRLYSIYAEISNRTDPVTSRAPTTSKATSTTSLPELAQTLNISSTNSPANDTSTSSPTAAITTTTPRTSTTPEEQEPTSIEIQLEQGRTPQEGLLYVRTPQGKWGTVCDDGWDDDDAQVVCRQKGFSDGRARYPPFFGQGSPEVEILLDDLQCNGSESELADCPKLSHWGSHNCYHREDAGVQCFNHQNETVHVLGFPAVQRSQTDRWMSGLYIPHPTLQLPFSRAIITEWHFYIQTAASADVALQVWRKKGNMEYMLVGQTEYHHLPPGRYDKTLVGDQRIHTEAGDVIGVQFSSFNPVPYDNMAGPCELEEVGLYAESPSAGVRPGVVYGFARKMIGASMCRMYSVYASYQVQDHPDSSRFTHDLSQYLVVSDLTDTHAQALQTCRRLLGTGANLINITSEREYSAVTAAITDMYPSGGATFWIGGYVNDPWWTYRRWGHCQPAQGKECVVLERSEDDFGIAGEQTLKMASRKCYETHNFVCELSLQESQGPELMTFLLPTTTAPPPVARPNQYVNATLTDVIRRRTIPPGTSAGIITVAVLSVVFTVLMMALLAVFIYRKCRRRIGPNDISESTVRFVSLYDKAPI